MVQKAVLTAGNPEGDVMFGVDNTFLSEVVDGKVFDPYTAAGPRRPPEGADVARAGRRGHADRRRRRLHQRRHGVVRRAPAGPAGRPRRPRRPGVQGPPRRREPGVVVTGVGVPAGHDREVRRRRVGRLLEAPAGQRRAGRRHVDRRLLRRLLRRRRRHQADRRQLRQQPAGRGGVRRSADRQGDDGQRRLDVLPPGRVRRRAARHRATPRGPPARRLHVVVDASSRRCR